MNAKSSSDTKRIVVAQFMRPHGVRGDLKFRSFTENPKDFLSYGELSDEAGERIFEVKLKSIDAGRGEGIVSVAGIDGRDQAAALTNQHLYAARDRLPKADADEYYYEDLLGMQLVTEQGEVLGEVIAMHDFGAGDVMEILGQQGKKEMLSFNEQTVINVSVEENRVIYQLLDSLNSET